MIRETIEKITSFEGLIQIKCLVPRKRFSKRHQRRNELVEKGSSKSKIWVLRLLICGPGALQLYLSKCNKRNHRRNVLASKGPSEANVEAFRVQICGHGALA